MDWLANLKDEVWNRVIVNWVPTLIGIAAAIGVVVLDSLTNLTATMNLRAWAVQAIAFGCAALGAYLKSKAKATPSLE